jgi:hypothetical protein
MPSEPRQSIQIVLTPEQREIIQQASGQQADMLELTPEDDTAGKGGSLQFRWRLSVASGIPRQEWVEENGKPARAEQQL